MNEGRKEWQKNTETMEWTIEGKKKVWANIEWRNVAMKNERRNTRGWNKVEDRSE